MKVNWSKELLEEIVDKSNSKREALEKISKKYWVSDVAVKKWRKNYEK